MDNFTPETLAIMRSYCGRDPREPREVWDEAFSEYGSESWSLVDFKSAIAKAEESIPAERRHTAVVELEGDYESATRLTIRYTRMETAAEVAENVARALGYVREVADRERRQYEALKAKYG